jgi:pimeloyl-ACP methyl ester carboxylesterase
LRDLTRLQSPIIRAFLLGKLKRPQGSKHHKFAIPLGILSKALDNLGDFPFKDPGEVRFEKPALFVRGTQSKYVPDEVLPTIGKFFPRFEVADIESGHWVISEKPEEFRQGMSATGQTCLLTRKGRLTLVFPLQSCGSLSAAARRLELLGSFMQRGI